MQQIEELTQKQLDILFIEIQKLIKQAIDKQLSSLEVLPQVVQKNLINRLKKKWHDFKRWGWLFESNFESSWTI